MIFIPAQPGDACQYEVTKMPHWYTIRFLAFNRYNPQPNRSLEQTRVVYTWHGSDI